MSKILFLLLIAFSVSKPNFLRFLQASSEKIDSTQILQGVSYSNSIKWVGFELPSSHIITKISWSGISSSDLMFGLFEGANEPTFLDAVPLYMFKEQSSENYINIESTASVKYIRYVSPLKKEVVVTNIHLMIMEKCISLLIFL